MKPFSSKFSIGGLVGSADVYAAFVRNAFLRLFAYRLRYFTGIFSYLLFVTVYYSIWTAVYGSRGEGALINGFTLPEMLTYVAVGWIARSFYFSSVDQEIDEMVRSGQISVYLIRPVDYQLSVIAYSLGQSLFRFLFFSLPIGVVILLVFPVQPPESLLDFVLFLFSTFIGAVVLVEINFLVGMLSFYLKSTQGVMRAKYYLVQLCSGLLLPLSFFPDWLEQVLNLLPFKTIAYVPLQIYLGKIPNDMLLLPLLNQLVWATAMFIMGKVAWRLAARKLCLQGG